MRIDPALSHLDHNLTPDHVAWILDEFGDRTDAFAATVDLPADFDSLPCGLYGPLVGDSPIGEDDVVLAPRGARTWPSRLVGMPPRPSRKVTVIAGPSDDGRAVVLYTAFGGPLAPREPGDPGLAGDPAALAESRAFWAEHALSR